jgi:hypothetical protein
MNSRLVAIPGVMEFATRRALQASLLLIEADARQMVPRDLGTLQGSINNRIVGEFPTLEGRVGPNVGYGAPVEFGRRAGARMPPVDALLGWVRRHWLPAVVGRPRRQTGQRVLPLFEGEVRPTNRRTAPRTVSDAMIRNRAWVLARSISRRGIRRRPYMSPAYHRNEFKIQQLFKEVGLSVVATLQGRQL